MIPNENYSSLAKGNSTPPSEDEDFTINMICKVFGIPISVVAITGNILFLVVLSKSRKSPGNIIITNLTIADLLAAVTLLLSFALQPRYEHISKHKEIYCKLWASIQLLPIYQQFIFLVLLNVDRFLTVTKPATYPDCFKEKKTWLICLAVWFYAVVFAALSFAFRGKFAKSPDTPDWQDGRDDCNFVSVSPYYLLVVQVIHLIPTTCFAVVIYLRIRHVLRMHQTKIQVTNTLAYDNLISDIGIAKVYFIITVCCFTIWIPFLVSSILWFTNMDLSRISSIIKLSSVFGHISTLTFIMLIIMLAEYRKKFIDMWSRNEQNMFLNRRSSTL